jgi:hypothetical protein
MNHGHVPVGVVLLPVNSFLAVRNRVGDVVVYPVVGSVAVASNLHLIDDLRVVQAATRRDGHNIPHHRWVCRHVPEVIRKILYFGSFTLGFMNG